ncbi:MULTISPECIES: LysR family transcriptional regulator [unclassified Novosphingobium]|uniref:LysR family transcriptional regulator n=1 Tax=unclassified Novosphingobium TaxID=2644732 RepID=UPI001494B7BF|nr:MULTISPECIES: LysR family transcriptional regulator [unclassified Novosphingobium]MBB3356915.1 DNA-binding transcriptional LysR family regulator [Novosphingobium sp. BK256]MBB3373316.1 DNA-binding transcriptional LysR family regulator [Novosphingobium sp. BK280]MBB3377685.1 DNA-binding transcriptional LysR family regulator [Novosphingobium sp. BK258]MBB3418904.1 DNA-binding transcriptional LysR family regulator [Novosphingobium sp. BK267]MBB3450261.1 DNA-binding transcriptional LysR family 
MDSTQHVRAMLSFVQAADRGSFAAAARHLGVSPAAVGKNISGLEAALGVRLINRTTRSLQLTEEGKLFLLKAREAIDALDAAVDVVTNQRTQPVGKVRISTSNGFGRHFLLPLLPRLIALYPGITPEIEFDDHQVDIVGNGFDLALRGGMIEDSALVARKIHTMQMVLVASPAYLAAHGIPRHLPDLADHRLIAVRFLGGRTSSWDIEDGGGEAFLPHPAALTFSDPEAAMIAAADGLGIAQVGLHYAWPLIREGRLRILLGNRLRSASREMVLLYPHRALIAARVRATIDFLVQEFGKIESLHVKAADLTAYRCE